jgi:hypothetical protein
MSPRTGIASRRDFLKNTGRLATASALAGVAVPSVHAAEDNTIRVALIGCGGRGTGYDQMLNQEHEFAPAVDQLAMDSPAPLPAGPDGKYPVPQPGITIHREY